MNVEWLARVFASAVVRKLAYLAVAGLIALSVSQAKANVPGVARCGGSNSCDQGKAKSACEKSLSYWKANSPYGQEQRYGQAVCIDVPSEKYFIFWSPMDSSTLSEGDSTASTQAYGALCSTRADLVALMVSSFSNGGKVCSFGCEYEPKSRVTDTTITDKADPSNAIRWGVIQDGHATGAVCSNPQNADDPKKPGDEPPPCMVVGQDSNGPISVCAQDDGRICHISGAGTKMCQPPPNGTEGPKVDAERKTGISQSTDPGSQPQPPAPRPGEDFGPKASTGSCNNVTGNCSITNVYGQNGTPNVNGTPIPGDGSKNGTGQQEGPGTGTGATGGGTTGTGTDMGPTNGILTTIKDKISEFADWFKGDGSTPTDPGEGVDPGDAPGVKDGETVDSSRLNTAGFSGGSCVAVASGGGGTYASALANGANSFTAWCGYISTARAIFILLASIVGVYILAGRKT